VLHTTAGSMVDEPSEWTTNALSRVSECPGGTTRVEPPNDSRECHRMEGDDTPYVSPLELQINSTDTCQ
jgi:hypothetical protein